MQFTKAESYGIFGVLYLAKQAQGKVTPLSEISEVQKVPEKFLAKIFQSLSKSGVIRSHRGVKGGFSLDKTASEISIKEIVESVHGPYYLAKCLNSIDACDRTNCPLMKLLEKAQFALTKVLSDHSVADILEWEETGKETADN
ncbi:MAG: Rrf2 family transcriptional regulator [candidate division Zixibacteria bacterium]|nr:Rrf2 family transcriptional regulator [candidate division Zixibacteria bacterium]